MDENVDMIDYLKRIRTVHHQVFLTFKLYQKLMIALSPAHVGEEQARINLEIYNEYKGVFSTTKSSTRYTSVMSLAVLFIPGRARNGDPSISLIDLIARIGNLPTKSQEQIDELTRLQQEIDEHQSKINVLKSWRDQQLAHLDLSPDSTGMSDKDLINLMGLSIKIIALADWCFEHTGLTLDMYRHNTESRTVAESEVDMDFDKLFNTLQG